MTCKVFQCKASVGEDEKGEAKEAKDAKGMKACRRWRCCVIEALIGAAFIFLPLVGAALFSACHHGRVDWVSYSIQWEKSLNKPWWNPPGWLFGPVWTTLYLMMGTASYLVFRASRCPQTGCPFRKKKAVLALCVFKLNLLLNWLWMPIFFGAHEMFLALVDILMLWVTVLVCVVLFFQVSGRAAALLLPYLFWVTFASFLNAKMWQLNMDD